MVSLESLPEIRTELFIAGEVRTADDHLQVIDPADGRSVVGFGCSVMFENGLVDDSDVVVLTF